MKKDGDSNFNPYTKFQMKIPADWQENPSAVMFITLKETLKGNLLIDKVTQQYGDRTM